MALGICIKLFFDYQQFYETNRWSSPDILLDAIHLIEQAKEKSPNRNPIAATINRIKEVTPDTEDFGEANYALNACVAICYTLNFLLENKPEYICHVGTSLYDTVDARVQDDHDLSEEEIDRHPLIIKTRRYLLQETQ